MPPVPDMTDTVPAARAEQTLFLLGGYTDKSVLAHAPQGGEGSGFYSVIFDPEAAKFQRLTSSEVKTNPAFIMKHPELDVVYMTTEVITKDGSEVLVGKLDRSAIASRISDVFFATTTFIQNVNMHLSECTVLCVLSSPSLGSVLHYPP